MKKVLILFGLVITFLVVHTINAEAVLYRPVQNTPTPYSEEYGGYGVREYTYVTYDLENYESGGYYFYKMPYQVCAPVYKEETFAYMQSGSSYQISVQYSRSESETVQTSISNTYTESYGYEYGIDVSGLTEKVSIDVELSETVTESYSSTLTYSWTNTSTYTYVVSETGYYQYQIRFICDVYIVQHYYTYGLDPYLPSRQADAYYVMLSVSGSPITGLFKCDVYGNYLEPIEDGIVYIS